VERAGLVPPAAVRDRLAGELARGRGRTSLVVVQVDGPDASHEAVALAAGRRLRGCVRALDPVGDAGGGRYWVLLTATPLATAMAVGRRACEAIGGHPLDGGRAVTASAGVAQATAGVPPAALIAAAEAAMLGAARAGGGRAVGAPPLVAAAGPAAA
jgi:GGDEF domain-containing protein